MRRAAEWLAVVGLLVCGGWCASAQEPMLLPTVTAVAAGGVTPDATVGGALRSMASRAGLVFVGQVDKIERRGGVVEITFGVDQVLLGSSEATYTLREWGGLWAAGEQRYRLGQRAMVFLHAASAAGLSSPVDGMEGVVPVVPMGADAAPLLDVRWLVARLQRLQGRPMVGDAIALSDAASVVSQWRTAGMEPTVRKLPVGWQPVAIEMPGIVRIAGNDHAAP